MRAEDILASGGVSRFHTIPTITKDSVAQHSWGVAVLVRMLTDWKCRIELVDAALLHDAGEVGVGDVPSPTKRSIIGMGEALDMLEQDYRFRHGMQADALTKEEAKILKLADCLDGMLHCVRERRLGNTNMTTCYTNYHRYVTDAGHALNNITVQVHALWEVANGR